MTTTEELLRAHQEHGRSIAELRARIDGHDDAIARHDRMIGALNETVSVLRETMGRVATKDDIIDLRRDIGEKFDKQLADAHNSIPSKIAAGFGAAMFLIALITLVVNLAPHHG